MSEVAELKTKRGRLKGSITKLKTFAENIPNERKTLEDLESRLELLEKLFVEFIVIDDKLSTLEVPSEFSEYEDKYLAVKPLLLHEIKTLRAAQVSQNAEGHSPPVEDLNSTMSRLFDQQRTFFDTITNHSSAHERSSLEIRLPKINIQPFSGDYKDWASFKDLFLTSVDQREGLSAAHKMQYLKGFLRGDAAALIKHFPVTETNYKEAWSKLIARYDKKRHILTAYIKAFVKQPTVSLASASQLRQLTDTSDEIIRGIAALGDEANGRDPWLIFCLLNKTDTDTRKAWAEHISDKEFPTLEEFLTFLGKRCDALEAIEPATKRTTSVKTTIRSHHSDISSKCPECLQQHPLFKCPSFKALDIQARRNLVNKHAVCFNCLGPGHQAQRCKSKFSCHFCKQRHHSTLHLTQQSNQVTSHFLHTEPVTCTTSPASTLDPHTPAFIQDSIPAGTQQPIGNSQIHTLTTFKSNHNRLSLLPTALVRVQDVTGKYQPCRMLIDSGSQASFISEECIQRLGLKRQYAKIAVHGIGSAKSANTKGKVTLLMSSRFDLTQQIQIQAYIITKLTSSQPQVEFNIEEWTHLKDYPIADPSFNQPNKIDILLGAEHFIQILKPGQYISTSDQLAMQNTIFGYIVAGSFNQRPNPIISCHANIADIDSTLRKFWETEEISQPVSTNTLEEEACEIHFLKTHYIDNKSKRYVVQLPFKEEAPLLGDSLDMSLRRFCALERKLQQNPTLRNGYCQFIKEYQQLGHLELVPPDILKSAVKHVYLPHHAIFKPDSSTTKLRVVFDGSASTSTGTSLNQTLMVGPKIQRDLFQILISFRLYKIAVTADVEKMFRMILMDKKDRNYQRILWRENPSEPIRHYWLNTVTYGTASAPFLATRCLQQLTIEFKGQYLLAEHALAKNFYVDDLMAGADSIDQAIQLKEELSALLALRGFNLRKWASNSQEFLSTLQPQQCNISSLHIKEQPDSVKVLGLKWIPAEDSFTFEVTFPTLTTITKRSILSESSRVFDPLGFLAPITIVFKILLQRLWLKQCSWDEQITGDLEKKWKDIRTNMHYIENLRIPRWPGTKSNNYQLHGFCDASESAYAAVVYCRSTSHNGDIFTTLLAAKTRVSPIKQLSIPRLELCGALLLIRLLQALKTSIGQPNINCFAWTDSAVVLAWLSAHPRKWTCFIANRTSEILNVLPRSFWNYVPSKENPADIASRGCLPQHLEGAHLWWHGPSWLQGDWTQKTTNITSPNSEIVNMESRPNYVDIYHTSITNDTLSSLFQQKSSFKAILRIIARCIRFYKNCNRSSTKSTTAWITTEELNTALHICIRETQADSFKEEIACLNRKKTLPTSSKLLQLTPFLDSDGLLRVGGRLENASCSYNVKHPLVLPKNHIFVDLIIKYYHEKYFHAGTSLLLSILRQRYWIISCRTLIKKHIHNCVKCVRHRAQTCQQLMANLPACRVSPTRAFESVGVDYAGPIPILLHRGRGAKSVKGYIALFVCLTTKALHLDVASDLSSEAFISCLKRFVARRGIPSNIFSDNATNFVGANRKLNELYKIVTSQTHNLLIADFLSDKGISWHFIPPSAPHFGGIWESGVRSVKTLLKRTIGDSHLTFEELTTLIIEIEGVLNSRPLVPSSDDINSIDALTPAHFLIGQPISCLPEPSMNDCKISLLTRWRLVQKIAQDFWKRWHLEYLTSLQHRPKWRQSSPNLEVGDLVIIRENNLPPSTWVLGRIQQTHPGRDQLVRVATIRTSKGEVKRPISKLVKLPVS